MHAPNLADFVWPNGKIAQQIAALRDGLFSVEHFLGENLSSRSLGAGYLGLNTAGGTQNTKALGIPGAYGVGRFEIPTDGAGAEDGAGCRQSQQLVLANEMFGKVYYSGRIQVDNPPAPGQDYSIAFGIMQPETAQRVSSDGIYWLANDVSLNWQLVTARAGAQTIDDSGIPIASSGWQTLEFEVDVTNGVATGIIEGEAVAEVIPPNIQPGATWGSEMIVHGEALRTAPLAVQTWLDWLGWGVEYAV